MPWQPRNLMETKREFIEMALQEGANRRELCRRFGISAKTGYELLKRNARLGMDQACTPQSTRPLNSPRRSVSALEQRVIELRLAHPSWGGRKIARRLIDQGCTQPPAPSTVTNILHRHGLITPEASLASQHWQRFEHERPNALWQMDFKGDIATAERRCFPLTVLDDHSRFNLALAACASVSGAQVQPQLQHVFRHYGLPDRVNADNGAPWGAPRQPASSLSALGVWLIRLGIRVSHSAPYHPQTNGKIERFHRSLKAEVLNGRSFDDLAHAQSAFDRWRSIYNHERPHDALDLSTPAKRYAMSSKCYPEVLPAIEYGDRDIVVTVKHNGQARFKGTDWKVPNSLLKLPIAFRPDPKHDGCFDVLFCHHAFMRIDLSDLKAT